MANLSEINKYDRMSLATSLHLGEKVQPFLDRIITDDEKLDNLDSTIRKRKWLDGHPYQSESL
ncbi:hypothetical protein NPIL_17211, partial [Nephila pilipes]